METQSVAAISENSPAPPIPAGGPCAGTLITVQSDDQISSSQHVRKPSCRHAGKPSCQRARMATRPLAGAAFCQSESTGVSRSARSSCLRHATSTRRALGQAICPDDIAPPSRSFWERRGRTRMPICAQPAFLAYHSFSRVPANVLIDAPEHGHGARDPASPDSSTCQIMQLRGFSQWQQSGEAPLRD